MQFLLLPKVNPEEFQLLFFRICCMIFMFIVGSWSTYRLRGYKLTEYRPDLPEPDNAGGGIIAEATLLLVHLSDIKGGVFLCLKI